MGDAGVDTFQAAMLTEQEFDKQVYLDDSQIVVLQTRLDNIRDGTFFI
jgi:hypothetical protein